MRVGGEIKQGYSNPDDWARKVISMMYSTVLCPVDASASSDVRAEYKKAANKIGVTIGEVGVWRNCLDLDDAKRKANMDYAKAQLALADEMGACCCVNIAGNRGEIWDGFSEENYADDNYALIVDSVREIIDAVNPVNTFYSLEPMPWMTPDTPEQYLQLIHDVDRKAFAVHLDFVNMINTPRKYVLNKAFIGDCFRLLGPYIKSIHGKDVFMENAYTTLIHETMPGKGILDYHYICRLVERLGEDTGLFVEHLPDEASYREASGYVKKCAVEAGVLVKAPIRF